jgi:hypothetical protein
LSISPLVPVPDPVSYTAVHPIGASTVAYVFGLNAERRRRRTRRGRRVLGCYRQAVLVLRWLLDASRIGDLVVDNEGSSSTAYRYLHEAIDVPAAAAPTCRERCSRPAPPGRPA